VLEGVVFFDAAYFFSVEYFFVVYVRLKVTDAL